jgi:hypothetical protein
MIHLKELSLGPFGTDFWYRNWVFRCCRLDCIKKAAHSPRLVFSFALFFPALPPHLHLRPPLLRCP